MKIYDRNLTGTSAAETGQAQEAQNLSRTGKSSSHTPGGVDGSNDRVEFSGTLSRLSRALTTFETRSGQPRSRAWRRITRSGNYKPDSAATSRGMCRRCHERRIAGRINKMASAALVEQLMSARQQLDFACELLAKPSPEALDSCASVLEAAGRQLAEWQPAFSPAGGRRRCAGRSLAAAAQLRAYRATASGRRAIFTSTGSNSAAP